MFDIGGGSSEIIWLRAGEPSGRAGRVQAWESMRLGVVSLAERFGGVDVTDETFTAMTRSCGRGARALCRQGLRGDAAATGSTFLAPPGR